MPEFQGWLLSIERRHNCEILYVEVEAESSGLGLRGLASASCPQPDLGLVNLASKKCAIQCKIILVLSVLWLFNCKFLFAMYAVKLSEYKDLVWHSNVGIKYQLCIHHHHHHHHRDICNTPITVKNEHKCYIY